ncbi:hypothetical protein DCMF_01475 [Candidatus Formimonas warabiya]|uniref:Uncharacterized protein n=2 Tax=Formimonas warabiya TaxID=1761012 RepID=A0A3G1L0G8_FORW1|nr:hypothetical protein DCMF_01475 [Candidatus Formimonas warabiya]
MELGTNQSGQVLVRMEGTGESRLDLYSYQGTKLPAYLIYVVLKTLLAEGWVEKLESLHQSRKNMWKVEVCFSPKGTKEYRLYTIEQHQPVCSSTIAISQGQIETFSIWSEDAAPLLKKVFEDYPPVFLPRYRNYRHFYFFPTHFPLFAKNIKFKEIPEPIKTRREEPQRIKVNHEIFLTDTFPAGVTSGIMETIEALKCLEVLMA